MLGLLWILLGGCLRRLGVMLKPGFCRIKKTGSVVMLCCLCKQYRVRGGFKVCKSCGDKRNKQRGYGG